MTKVRQAVAGGVNVVQLREKDLPLAALLRLAIELREATKEQALLIVNGPPEVAAAAGADGVHLPEDGPTTASVREVLGGTAIIGRSVHSLAAALRAEAEGAEYIQLGSIYPSRSHPGRAPAGLTLLQEIAQSLNIPVIAVGGITADNMRATLNAGAAGCAVISAILAAANTGAATRDLLQAMSSAWGMAMITATINGSRRTIAAGITIAQFVEELPLNQRFVAVAHNGDVVPRERWGEVSVEDGDVIEVVRMVGGG